MNHLDLLTLCFYIFLIFPISKYFTILLANMIRLISSFITFESIPFKKASVSVVRICGKLFNFATLRLICLQVFKDLLH